MCVFTYAFLLVPQVGTQASLRENSDCFLRGQQNVRALGFYGHADLLFFSDTGELTISRVRLIGTDYELLPITANVASVKGACFTQTLYFSSASDAFVGSQHTNPIFWVSCLFVTRTV